MLKIEKFICNLFKIEKYQITIHKNRYSEYVYALTFESEKEITFFNRKIKPKLKVEIHKDIDDYYIVFFNNTCKFKCDQLSSFLKLLKQKL